MQGTSATSASLTQQRNWSQAALPPRSRVPAITGAASGVIVAASAFSPRTSRLLPWILAWPKTAPCFLWP